MITALDKRSALVLIDLQKGIVKYDTAHPIKDILAQANILIDAFRKAGLPIVFVTVNPMGAAWTKARVEQPSVPTNVVTQTVAKVIMPATGFDELVPELIQQPGADIHIRKHTWSAFFETTLHQQLQAQQVTNIVLGGVSTSVGVEGTARTASELGYNLSFASDAMTDRSLDAHQHSLKNIFPRIGEIGTTQDILNKLSSRK